MDKENPEEEPLMQGAIEKYKMNDLEAKAYKISLLWMERSRRLFPDYRHATMKKGDPRKSLMFKICYKLARETQGVLDDEEYPLYVRAQLEVLKHVNGDRADPLIDPNCLVGEKAWKRWKLWKRKYDSRARSAEPVATNIGIAKAMDGLEKTHEFLTKTFSSDLSFDRFKEAYINKNIFRWINLNKISPYYICISTFIKRLFNEDDFGRINFDAAVYLPCVDGSVRERFAELFPLEQRNTLPENID